MITGDSEFREFYDAVNANNPCASSVVWADQIDKSMPCREAMKSFLADGETPWLYWVLEIIGHLLDGEMRRILFQGVTNPAKAFRIYVSMDNLDEEDDEVLFKKFEGKLRRAENQIKASKVKRAKNG